MIFSTSSPNVSGLCQRCGIDHGKRHIEYACQRLREQRLAATCRPDEQNIRFG